MLAATPNDGDETTAVEHTVWQQDDVDPAAVEEAMRALERERFRRRSGGLQARALNLVAIVDADFAGEITRRLDEVGRNAPSRTILVRVVPQRDRLSARVTVTTNHDGDGIPAVTNERVTVNVAQRHLTQLESIVDPMVITDVPTLAWAPHGHVEALESIGALTQTLLVDTTDAPDARSGFDGTVDLLERHGLAVVDLAWLRAAPWRQRLAAHFAPTSRRRSLTRIAAVTVRHAPGSEAAAWLMLGWLGARLGWQADGGAARDADGAPIALELTPVEVGVRGLAGATLAGRDGARFALDRNPGGLLARRTEAGAPPGPDPAPSRQWTVMGASRGEVGVLSSALRRTLVPDAGYREALATARKLIACT